MEASNTYSRIISGCMTWGSWGKKLSTSQMTGVINHCLDLGLTTFDHADIYGDYGTEADFGKAFAQSGISRSDVQLISKCGIQMTRGRQNQLNHYQYDKDYIVWSAEESLKKLRTEYLDLLLLHRPSPLMEPEEIAEAAFQLLKKGKIKKFGVSNFTPSQIAMLEKALPISCNQVEFSLTHEGPMYDGTFDDCITNNRMAMAWSPLGSFFRETTEQTKRIKKVMDLLMGKYGLDESQLLLAWIIKHPANVHPVIGTTDKERIMLAVKAAEVDLELQDWFALLEASQGHQVP
ncbi:aldo/keto reductase [Flagellimonas meishanensis]|uniref:aldo/keto reductase n=1 Tax=Flagellimonas meishanensis TaxID=2873264 RepID=UPI001CA672C6|nr:aldo/keto reductase [[Muricauda] meishanensis]